MSLFWPVCGAARSTSYSRTNAGTGYYADGDVIPGEVQNDVSGETATELLSYENHVIDT